ncbi:MAG: hypothetical protein ACKO7Q_01460 [Actinomycetota bacterium]
MLVDDLRAACADDWRAFTHHPFVAALADATRPEAAWRTYLVQDYRFLAHFARAHALEAFKADTVEDLEWATSAAAGIIATEMRLHVAYCEGWGIGVLTDKTISRQLPVTNVTMPNVLENLF